MWDSILAAPKPSSPLSASISPPTSLPRLSASIAPPKSLLPLSPPIATPFSMAALLGAPTPPSETTGAKLQQVRERFQKRLGKIADALPIRAGRLVPSEEDMILGGATRLNVSVLFLDICGFSKIESGTDDEQDYVFKIMNLFMSEMLTVVRDFGGDFEKNTGDGLMAYFSGGTEKEQAKKAVDAAVTMHCYNDQVLGSLLERNGLQRIKFRIGIEVGKVTVAKVGVRSGFHHSLVAIGNTANVACKLMNLIPDGGTVLGAYTKGLLAPEWQSQTKEIPQKLEAVMAFAPE